MFECVCVCFSCTVLFLSCLRSGLNSVCRGVFVLLPPSYLYLGLCLPHLWRLRSLNTQIVMTTWHQQSTLSIPKLLRGGWSFEVKMQRCWRRGVSFLHQLVDWPCLTIWSSMHKSVLINITPWHHYSTGNHLRDSVIVWSCGFASLRWFFYRSSTQLFNVFPF